MSDNIAGALSPVSVPELRRPPTVKKVIMGSLLAMAWAVSGSLPWAGLQALEQELAIPGNPKGNLPTELLQAVAYTRGLELALDTIEKRYPSLGMEVLAARSSWNYSPFAKGAAAIVEDITSEAKDKGVEIMAAIDSQTRELAKKYDQVDTLAKAKDFLKLVDRRAKGDIEVPQVRANLLWNCPAYVKDEIQEIRDGYVVLEECEKEGMKVSLKVPMSWMPKATRVKSACKRWGSHGNHGQVSCIIGIDRIPSFGEVLTSPHQLLDEMTEQDFQDEFGAQEGAKLLSFKKTRADGRPAILITSRQEVEQLGVKVVFLQHLIQFYHYDRTVSLSLLVPSAPGLDDEARLKKYQPLFLFVANSFHVDTDAIDAEKAAAVTSPAPLSRPRPGAEKYPSFKSDEFGFVAGMPKDVEDLRLKHQYGEVTNFKSLDEPRLATVGVSVNRVDPFVQASQRGEKGWEGAALDGNFKSYTANYQGILKSELRSSKIQWLGSEAYKYSFPCTGEVEGATTYHTGILFLNKGHFFNLSITSLLGADEAEEDLSRLKDSFRFVSE